MPEITQRVSFFQEDAHAEPKTLHIETEGAVVNITVGLTDDEGRTVTRIAANVDDESRGGDGQGRIWTVADANEHGLRLVAHPAHRPDDRSDDTAPTS